MSSAERIQEQIARAGVAPPLPARYEAVDGGHFKLRVQTADALTKDWRTNLQAADIGTVPPVVDERPQAPKAYNLPKVVLERQPDESLDSEPYAPEYAPSRRLPIAFPAPSQSSWLVLAAMSCPVSTSLHLPAPTRRLPYPSLAFPRLRVAFPTLPSVFPPLSQPFPLPSRAFPLPSRAFPSLQAAGRRWEGVGRRIRPGDADGKATGTLVNEGALLPRTAAA